MSEEVEHILEVLEREYDRTGTIPVEVAALAELADRRDREHYVREEIRDSRAAASGYGSGETDEPRRIDYGDIFTLRANLMDTRKRQRQTKAQLTNIWCAWALRQAAKDGCKGLHPEDKILVKADYEALGRLWFVSRPIVARTLNWLEDHGWMKSFHDYKPDGTPGRRSGVYWIGTWTAAQWLKGEDGKSRMVRPAGPKWMDGWVVNEDEK